MKIRQNFEEIEIYGIYWNSYQVHLYGLPPWHSGAIFYNLYDVIVVDDAFSIKMTLHRNGDLTGMIHWALLEKNLFEGVSNHDLDMTIKFLEILKEEGNEREDYQMIDSYHTYGKI